MIEAKFNEYGLAISGTGGSSCDKQQPSVKKTALRDLQNENRNIISKPLGNSPLPKVIGPVGDAEKVGSKRPNSDCLSLCNNNTSGKIVYIRRKAEPEPGKIISCDNFDNSIPPQSRELSIEKEESHRQPSQIKEPKISYFSAFSPIPVASLTTVSSGAPLVPHSLMTSNRSTVAEPNYPMVSSTGIHTLVSPQNTYNQNNRHWEERFQRLQLFLKSCDQSNQEEYIQIIRALSAMGRSKLAIELEKRAVHLLLEEGKELRRMKVLNVLGKALPKNCVPASTQVHPAEIASEK